MSIATELTRLNTNKEALATAKTAIASAITTKGGTVASGDGFADFATDIASIPSGGGDVPTNAIYQVLEYTSDGYPKKIKVRPTTGTVIPKNFMQYNTVLTEINKKVESVEIPTNTTEIGDSAFDGMSVDVVNSDVAPITKIGDYAFRSGKWFIPSTIVSFGTGAFMGNSKLDTSDIIFPSSLVSIGNKAFSGIRSVNIYFNSTPTIGTEAFDAISVRHIYVPWAEGEVANAPWGATNATIHYNYTSEV